MRAREPLEQVRPAQSLQTEIFISLAWLNCLLLVYKAQVSGMWPTDSDLPVAKMMKPSQCYEPKGLMFEVGFFFFLLSHHPLSK